METFDFNFVMKFVDGDPVENIPAVTQTGDFAFAIVAAILAFVAIVVGVLFCVRKFKYANSNTTQSTTKCHFELLVFAISVIVLSMIAFTSTNVASGVQDEPQEVNAYVFDDGTVKVDPITITNNTKETIKVQKTIWNLTEAIAEDTDMQKTYIEVTAKEGIVFKGNPSATPFEDVTAFDRLEPGESVQLHADITNVKPEVAQKYLDQNVYICKFVYQDAVVPYPDLDDPEIEYDGHFHLGVNTQTENWLPEFYASVSEPQQDVKIVDEQVAEYTTTIELKPGFIWISEMGIRSEDPFVVTWKILPKQLTLTTNDDNWDYDTTAHTSNQGTVTGLVEKRYNTPDEDEYKTEVVALDDASRPSITHYYQGKDNALENSVEIDWYPACAVGQIPAKETNYSVSENFGHLTINKIDLTHSALDQEYVFNTTYQGVDSISESPLDSLGYWCQHWFENTDGTYTENVKQIRNVADSGNVSYKIVSYVNLGTSELPNLVDGDYNDATGSYLLTVERANIGGSSGPKVSALKLDGIDTFTNENGIENNIYAYNGAEQIPGFSKSGPDADILKFTFTVGSETYVDSPYSSSRENFWIFTWGQTPSVGSHYFILQANTALSNYRGTINLDYYIWQQTIVKVDDPLFNSPVLYRNEIGDENIINTTTIPSANNPIYGNKDNIIVSFDEALVNASPYNLSMNITYSDESTATVAKDYQSDKDNTVTIPVKKDGDVDIWPKEITISWSWFVALSFDDVTGKDEGSVIYEAPAYESDLVNHYSHVEYKVVGTADAPQPYTSGNRLYPAGTGILTEGYDANQHIKTLQPAMVKVGGTWVKDSAETYYYIVRGDNFSSGGTAIDTKQYVESHYNYGYSEFPTSPHPISSDIYKYKLDRKNMFSLNYKNGHTNYTVDAQIPWAVPQLHLNPYTVNFETDMLYEGLTVDFVHNPSSDYPWDCGTGWYLYYNEESPLMPDYESGEGSSISIEMPSGDTDFAIEPWVLLNITGEHTIFDVELGDESYSESYVPSADYGIYVPQNSQLTVNDPAESNVLTYTGMCVYKNTGTFERLLEPDYVINFTANPISEAYCFDGWNGAPYTTEVSADEVYGGPAFNIIAPSSERVKYSLTWNTDEVSSLTIDGETKTSGSEQVYDGSEISVKFNKGSGLTTDSFSGIVNDASVSSYVSPLYQMNYFNYDSDKSTFIFNMPEKNSKIMTKDWEYLTPVEISEHTDFRFNSPDIKLGWNNKSIWYPVSEQLLPNENLLTGVIETEDDTIIDMSFPQSEIYNGHELQTTQNFNMQSFAKDAAFDWNSWTIVSELSANHRFKYQYDLKDGANELSFDDSFDDFIGAVYHKNGSDMYYFEFLNSDGKGWNYAVAGQEIHVMPQSPASYSNKQIVVTTDDGSTAYPFTGQAGEAIFTMPNNNAILSIQDIG